MPLPSLRIVATGGTIAGVGAFPGDTLSYAAARLDVSELCAAVPGMGERARISMEQFAAIDSKDATPFFWQSLARRLQQILDAGETDGIVVTHGTDTLEETAYYLHLVLKTAKPVVLVGAMRPATALSPDGPLNLLNAVTVAAAPEAAGKGVMVVMNHAVFGAREVAKLDTAGPEAFGAPNAGPLAWVQDGGVSWLARPEHLHTLATRFSADTPLPQVEILAGYAGVSPWLLEAVKASGARGLVWAGPGHGSAGIEALAVLKALQKADVYVVRATRCGSGCVTPGEGMLGAGTLSPWKARVLLMLAIGTGYAAPERLQALFDTH